MVKAFVFYFRRDLQGRTADVSLEQQRDCFNAIILYDASRQILFLTFADLNIFARFIGKYRP